MVGKIFAAIGVMSVAAVTVSVLAGDRIDKALEDIREKQNALDEDYDDEWCDDCCFPECDVCSSHDFCPFIGGDPMADRAALRRVIDSADEDELFEIEELINAARASRAPFKSDDEADENIVHAAEAPVDKAEPVKKMAPDKE